MVIIEKDIPIPQRKGKHWQLCQDVATMEVGDSFIAPPDLKVKLITDTLYNNFTIKLGWKFTYAREDNNKYRFWRIK